MKQKRKKIKRNNRIIFPTFMYLKLIHQKPKIYGGRGATSVAKMMRAETSFAQFSIREGK